MIDPTFASTVIETAGQAMQTQDGESIRTGVWVTAGTLLMGLFGLAGIYFNTRRGILETVSAGRAADFKRLREEIERRDAEMDEAKQEWREEIKALRNQIAEFTRKAAETDLKVFKLQTGFGLVSTELAHHDPGNQVLKQARDLIAGAAMSDDEVIRTGIAALAAGKSSI